MCANSVQFIHDPLLNWGLTNKGSPMEPNFPSERRQSIVGDQLNHDIANPHSHSFRPRARSGTSAAENANDPETKETQNARAVQVLSRVKEKLTGKDFKTNNEAGLEIAEQVNRLLAEACKLENLCQHYIGWCSFW
jgi:FKBP12-rapamycin complex-associated protein